MLATSDNENPYVDIRLYPQDNWREILSAYARRNAIPSIVEVASSRRMGYGGNGRAATGAAGGALRLRYWVTDPDSKVKP